MIEALITMVVLSVGLLSVAALQTRALQASHLSYQRSIAVSQANDAIERLWAGICQVFDEYNTPEENLKDIEKNWQDVHKNTVGMSEGLANWTGSIDIEDEGDEEGSILITVTIEWNDGRVENSQFVYNTTMIPKLRGCLNN
ncbi:MAG: hypothetical protein MZV65_07235 [Chromatiales bacterium]|nr:hypothetical protein [Chromatiales bacterium]